MGGNGDFERPPRDALGGAPTRRAGSRRRAGKARTTLHVLRPQAAPVVAIAAVVLLGLATRLPGAGLGDTATLQSRFSFTRLPLASVPVAGFKRIRQVEPRLERISAWISAVGAAVALADVDGNGRSDDVCLTDPRTDTVTVSPAPTTGARYRPFVLDPAPLAFDRATTAPMGCLPGDFNEDGRLDLLVYWWGRSPVLFLRTPARLGPAGFRRQDLVPSVKRWYTDSIDAADVDGDGHVDLIVANYFPDGARILDAHARSDPALQMNDSLSRAYNGGRDRILLWRSAQRGRRPAVAFRDVSGTLRGHIAAAWTLAIGAYDLNGDLRPELYFANDFGPDRLFVNESTPGHVRLRQLKGRRGLFVPKSKVLGNDSFKGMGIDFADIDGDGRTDMFVSNITTQFGLMESNFAWLNRSDGALDGRAAPFSDRSERLGLSRSGWGWDAKFGDFDNDGVPELVQATGFVKGTWNAWPQVAELAIANDDVVHDIWFWPNLRAGMDLAGHENDNFFVRGPHGRFGNVNRLVGLDDHGVSRGVSVADVDGDGHLDFALARQWERSYLYVNRCRLCGRALQVRLLLPQRGGARLAVRRGVAGDRLSGSPAVGAEAALLLPGARRLTAQVDGGNGHASVRSPELHFGLGQVSARQRLPLRIAWRDSRGAVRRLSLSLTPGRWTVRLPGAAHG